MVALALQTPPLLVLADKTPSRLAVPDLIVNQSATSSGLMTMCRFLDDNHRHELTLQSGGPVEDDSQRLTRFIHRLTNEESFAVSCNTVLSLLHWSLK